MAETRISEETRERVRKAWPDVLAGLANGELVRAVLVRHGISDPVKRAFLATEPGAQEDWDRAREASADAFMDQALETANNPTDDAAHARTRIDTLKWAARIRNPRLYGDKQVLDVNVRTVDLTRIIQDANARLAAAREPRVIEGAVIPNALIAKDILS